MDVTWRADEPAAGRALTGVVGESGVVTNPITGYPVQRDHHRWSTAERTRSAPPEALHYREEP